jgi:hypothetical protein
MRKGDRVMPKSPGRKPGRAGFGAHAAPLSRDGSLCVAPALVHGILAA